ncbi:hypothetical protein GCM10008917_24750 [Paraclostridium tenue]|uniref:Uncharacterized protein n=1 Tax=Paraclostridium tenue TaxID=1737 RepID=A0ABP3XJN6_9FIRM
MKLTDIYIIAEIISFILLILVSGIKYKIIFFLITIISFYMHKKRSNL